MVLVTVLLALGAGFFAGNGLPYFLAGSMGDGTNPGPFGESAIVNVVVGWIAFVIAGVCWRFAQVNDHAWAGWSAAGAGVLLVGLIHARNWRNNPWPWRRGAARTQPH